MNYSLEHSEALNLPGEFWLTIPNTENYYQASSFGRIRSVERLIKRKDGSAQIYPACILQQQPAGNSERNYLHVCLNINGKRKGIFVHQLIALAFLGEIPPNHEVHHRDEISAHNYPDNLIYLPSKEHQKYHRLGERNPAAILTEKDIPEIRFLLEKGEKQKKIAEKYGVTKETIGHIKRGLTWKHL